MTLRLFVGNQRFSSWSLRPWICLVEAGLEFETVVLRFDDPTFKSKVPGTVGKVPVLVDGDLVVHESLAICEHVAELAPSAGLWPGDLRQRALARSFASEMHAGFASLRTECSMDVCRAEAKGALPTGPFQGVPFLIKDLGLEVAGMKRTDGTFFKDDAPDTHDALLTKRFSQLLRQHHRSDDDQNGQPISLVFIAINPFMAGEHQRKALSAKGQRGHKCHRCLGTQDLGLWHIK